jgi:glycerophosphoryl diester phosphodiesterase
MSVPAPAPGWLTARPIAHRGLHDGASGVVENTLSAFSAAIEGDYAIECDLQVSRDGEAFVFHDATLDRLTDATGAVEKRSASELEAVAVRGTSDRIPRLAQLLDLVAGKVPLVIEIKAEWQWDPGLTRRTLELLGSYGGPHCIMSFDPRVVAMVRQFSPGTVRGMTVDRALDPQYNALPTRALSLLRSMGYLASTAPHFLSAYFRDLPWAPVTALRDAALPVISWTIRSPAEARDALRHSDQITFEGFRA